MLLLCNQYGGIPMTPEEKSQKLAARLLPLLQQGKSVEIHPQGSSMFPLLTGSADSVIICSLTDRPPKTGDILLYQRNSGLLVLHRLCRICGEEFYFAGDNQTQLEGPLYSSQLVAVVTHIRRKGHLFSVTHPLYRIYSESWRILRPIRPFISRPLGHLCRLLSGRRKNKD